MTILTPTATTSTTLASIWKKFQAKVTEAVSYKVPEFQMLSDMKEGKYLPTTREVFRPIRIAQGYGIGAIAEGAARAVPGTAAPVDLTLTLNHYQGQFAIPQKIMLIAQNGGEDAMIMSQLKYAARDKFDGFTRYLGDSLYMPSSAVRALTSTALNSATVTLTLQQGLSQSFITDAGYISRLFAVGDRVQIMNAGTAVALAVGPITAISATTPSITVVYDGATPTDPGATCQVVLANTLDNTANDYNKGLAANLMDIYGATILHGISDSTYPQTGPQLTDTSGGRFTGVRFMKGQDAIENFSPYEADACIIAQDVHRDVVAQYQAQLRFASPYKMDIDGSISAEGVTFFKTKRVPNGTVSLYAKDAWEKFFGRPDVEDFADIEWSELRPSENYSFMYGGLDWVGNTVCNSRPAFAFWNGLSGS